MFIATIVVSIILALVLVGSGTAKLRKEPTLVESLGAVGVPVERFWQLAALEYAGAAGLIIGLFWAPLGIAAAIGVVLYFLGAVGAHVRTKDWKGLPPAAVIFVVAIAALVLRSVTA